MSHLSELAKMAVLETINVGLGTTKQRSQSWPHGATPVLEEIMKGLTPNERHLFMKELGTLTDKIVQL